MVNSTNPVEIPAENGTLQAPIERVTHHLGNAAQIMCFMDCQGKTLEARTKLLEAINLLREVQNDKAS